MTQEQEIPLARAIAVRSFDESQRTLMRLAELMSGQYAPPHPLIREAMILASTSMYERILLDPPTVPVDLKASTASVFDDLGDDVFNEMIRAMQTDEAEPLSITGSQLRSFAKATAEVGLTSLIPVSIVESGDSSRKLRQVNEARKIGVERSIDPAAFYTDDELYAELVRRSQAPREVVKSGIEMIGHVTPEKMGEMIMNMTLEPVIDKKMVRTETLRWKTAFRTLTGEEIVRFWGQDGLDSL